MLLIRLATLWWAVLVGFMALGCLRLRFPRELGSAAATGQPRAAGEVSAPEAAAAPPVSRRA
jgi:hypothetical protein